MRGLEGKVAVVAGGATGIGAATARRLAEEGAQVVVGDLDGPGAERLASTIEGAVGVPFDIADEASVDGLFAAAESHFGGVDLVHANAADLSPETIGRDSDLLDLPLEVLDRTLAVNLRGHVLVTRRALPGRRNRVPGGYGLHDEFEVLVPSDDKGTDGRAKRSRINDLEEAFVHRAFDRVPQEITHTKCSGRTKWCAKYIARAFWL